MHTLTPRSFFFALAVTALGCGSIGAGEAEPSALSPEQLADATRASMAMAMEIPFTGIGHAAITDGASVSGPTAGPVDTRPYKYKVPKGYDKTKPTPLLVMLHGFTASGDINNVILGLVPLADSKNFLYAFPDGTQNPLGMRFWNATDFCCNFFGSTVDDVAYITAVIDDMASKFNVDAKRVFLVGHSNGGFMSHRMACDRSSKIAGIVSLAGMQWNDATKCNPTDKVAVLQVHGNNDLIVAYKGGPLYPSAEDTVTIWANRNRCTGRLENSGLKRDLDVLIPGAETTIERFSGCPAPGNVELWTMGGVGHVPAFTAHWGQAIWDYLMAHPKP